MSDTPETDAEELHEPYLVNELPFCVVRIDFARRLERERNEARQKLEIAMAANSDVERIAKERNEAQKAFAIATDQLVQVQGELRQAREENARLREALADCASYLEGWHTMEALENARKLLTP